jgi:hypothetical protein
MGKKNRSNQGSPNQIRHACDLTDLDGWFRLEAAAVKEDVYRSVVLQVYERLDAFVSWPERALLLWDGCDRSKKYHCYPPDIRDRAKQAKLTLDARTNGPAVAAFRLAGGMRPARFGSKNAWSVHHHYSGKFPYPGKEGTLHAARDGRHCTQSAGLVAVHPIADQMCDEYPFFAWLLRAQAFQRFGYDPDGVFSDQPHDPYGFGGAAGCLVVAGYW